MADVNIRNNITISIAHIYRDHSIIKKNPLPGHKYLIYRSWVIYYKI